MIDVSHAGEQTVSDILKLQKNLLLLLIHLYTVYVPNFENFKRVAIWEFKKNVVLFL
ncbi:MAG: hypothetical protein Ct9H300mP29_7920 [Candidatus Neomarinimicrobiota bacterium]|nr:MAG: hypothetical protein Ct9H300mP29_7920 [Candidatus Neomarinimicrobiota bacterium]